MRHAAFQPDSIAAFHFALSMYRNTLALTHSYNFAVHLGQQ